MNKDLTESELSIRENEAKRLVRSIKKNSYELGELLRTTKEKTRHGRFERFVESVDIHPRTVTNLIKYASVINYAAYLEKRRGVGIRDKVISLPHNVVYQLGSRNLTDRSRENILLKIGSGEYGSPEDIVAEIVTLNLNRSHPESEEKNRLAETLTRVKTIVRNGMVVDIFRASDGKPFECPRLPNEIFRDYIPELAALAGEAKMQFPATE